MLSTYYKQLGVHCKYVHGKYHEKLYFWSTTKSCIFWNILRWFKFTNYSLYDIKKYFQKYNWKYRLSPVIKCPKGNITPWKDVFLKVNIVFAV